VVVEERLFFLFYCYCAGAESRKKGEIKILQIEIGNIAIKKLIEVLCVGVALFFPRSRF
jgi:hypothetical protein